MTGEYQHNMDQKGRITIPSKFRDELGDKFYVCKGTMKCLFIYSEKKMQQIIDKIDEMPASQSMVLRLHFLAGAAEVEPDKQGRILVPQNLRKYAGIAKECVVLGTGNQAQIWDQQAWEDWLSSSYDMSSALDIASM